MVSFKRYFIRHMRPMQPSIWDKIDWIQWRLNDLHIDHFNAVIYGPPQSFKTTIAEYLKDKFPGATVLTAEGSWTRNTRNEPVAIMRQDLAFQTYTNNDGRTVARILKARWFEADPEHKVYPVFWPKTWRVLV